MTIQINQTNINVPSLYVETFADGTTTASFALPDGKGANFPTKLQGVDAAKQAGLDAETEAELVDAIKAIKGIPQAILVGRIRSPPRSSESSREA